MGLTPATGAPKAAKPDPLIASVGSPAAPALLPPALVALLGSEDSLFRDPFADFVPSSR